MRPTIEKSACGVGLVASTTGEPQPALLQRALSALVCVEHRGGFLADGRTGDGAGIMTEVPFDLLGYSPGEAAIGTLFIDLPKSVQPRAREVLEATLEFFGLRVLDYRDVPVDTSVLGPKARETMPSIVHAFIGWPAFCPTESAFDSLLYHVKQRLRTQMTRAGFSNRFFCTSLSTTTIIYKGLTRSEDLARFYPDLSDTRYSTRFAMFHRRFSTNTSTSWDKAQPFRMIAHNGEINTIECNRAWSYSREQALGLVKDELLTHEGISDSGNLNEMVEALRYRSSIPRLDEILAIMVPPANPGSPFYDFWGRAVEPWDGPAFLAYSDGQIVGARLDRNGFRPCRWSRTKDAFYLASEAGIFGLDESDILEKGNLSGGCGAQVTLRTGELSFEDPSKSRRNRDATFDPRLEPVGLQDVEPPPADTEHLALFGYTKEDLDARIGPMIKTGKEPIGSMGDTARPAVFSELRRPFFDFFFQTFAQVTNPPLDHLRERLVTDLRSYLGARPNVFQPKALLPVTPGIELSSPVLSPAQLAWVQDAAINSDNGRCFETQTFAITFPRVRGKAGLREALDALATRVLAAIRGGCSILVLSDRGAKYARPPIPSLLALRAADDVLTRSGHRLETSIVVDTADVRSTHHLAALVSFGAAAVCPYAAFEIARRGPDSAVRQSNLRKSLEAGLLKIMSKMGISTLRGYQGSRLFSAFGLNQRLLDAYFPGLESPIGGLGLEDIADSILKSTESSSSEISLAYTLREHRKGTTGERHSMTAEIAKKLHSVAEDTSGRYERWTDYEDYVAATEVAHPISPRHLFDLRAASEPTPLEDVQPIEEILRRIGSGAMSFGAISAEAQRDIIIAMKRTGGRSASGEGGENPYYFTEGTTASTKQVASARFGVTAEYLMTGEEIEIKVAQGAKPGEGGQLMGIKVNADIARARHSTPGVDLISPPPLHDIYSIEDLRELIYELKQLKPGVRVCVKLVSGANIGAIAAGVVKAGANIIQISGGDGGTGAATLSSMKHAGLPWELGLVEVHQTLVQQNLRQHVMLRVDGGLSTGKDIVIAALLGAEAFGLGKLLLIAQGCIMARVCEKNTCPRGIATHAEKFKAKYRGSPEAIRTFLEYLAEDVRKNLSAMGQPRLEAIVGRADLLVDAKRHEGLVEARGIDLSGLRTAAPHSAGRRASLLPAVTSRLNARIAEDVRTAVEAQDSLSETYRIASTDRAVLATASGWLAARTHRLRMQRLRTGEETELHLAPGTIDLRFEGSAGQGFGAFAVAGMRVRLVGEANDSVCKSMAGAEVVIVAPERRGYEPERSTIIGNGGLYGATSGTLFVCGHAGDRFAVRNSGATAVVEGAGIHACEYMTNGTVVILGEVGLNVGAGMTGGTLYLPRLFAERINTDYLEAGALTPADTAEITALIERYRHETGSRTAADLSQFVACRPKKRGVRSGALPIAS